MGAGTGGRRRAPPPEHFPIRPRGSARTMSRGRAAGWRRAARGDSRESRVSGSHLSRDLGQRALPLPTSLPPPPPTSFPPRGHIHTRRAGRGGRPSPASGAERRGGEPHGAERGGCRRARERAGSGRAGVRECSRERGETCAGLAQPPPPFPSPPSVPPSPPPPLVPQRTGGAAALSLPAAPGPQVGAALRPPPARRHVRNRRRRPPLRAVGSVR